MKRKTVKRRRKLASKTKSSSFGFKFRFVFITIFVLFFVFSSYYFRNNLACYLGFKSYKTGLTVEEKRISDVRNNQVLQNNQGKVVGIDISEYQEKIDWNLVKNFESDYPIQYVFIRATAGYDRVDGRFNENWKEVKKHNLLRGAYHYYRPNENSIQQADFFIKNVKLEKGDLPPVLDIEKLPQSQSIDSLKVGLHRWLNRVESYYKVRPIIYSGESYYTDFLKEEFNDYLFWIANYNVFRKKIDEDWLFWQFTEKAIIPGIERTVDMNIYNGDLQQLQFITID